MDQTPDRIERLSEENTGGGLSIDYKRVASRALRFWYIIVVSLGLSLAYSYFKNRYAAGVYSVNASVLIREGIESNSASILYQNALVNNHQNYLNGPVIIRSYPLIGRVVKDLNLEVAFFQEGKIKSTELYGMPVRVKLLNQNNSYGSSIIFEAMDEASFSIKTSAKDKAEIFRFGDSVRYQHHYFLVTKEPDKDIRTILRSPITITFLDPLQVTGSYVSRVGVAWALQGAAVINLSVSGSNPDKELAFMNGLIAGYQQYDLDKKNL